MRQQGRSQDKEREKPCKKNTMFANVRLWRDRLVLLWHDPNRLPAAKHPNDHLHSTLASLPPSFIVSATSDYTHHVDGDRPPIYRWYCLACTTWEGCTGAAGVPLPPQPQRSSPSGASLAIFTIHPSSRSLPARVGCSNL